ncbi:serine/threonine-protein kinase pim-2-like [Leuresthes tenuis]|uniref:serine/threonine-protein kinase pim-2-like n=1 Tax=Leuresthes tenuis TaxID=355514 RepID=UPI003B505EA5
MTFYTTSGSLEKTKTPTNCDVSKKSIKRKNSSTDSEEHCKKKKKTEPGYPTATSASSINTNIRDVFQFKYEEQELLGNGGFSSVFAGYRKEDNVKVAIKRVPQSKVERVPKVLNGKMSDVPLEVEMLIQVGAAPQEQSSSTTPALLDWFDGEDELILVFERTNPCMDLLDYLNWKLVRRPEREVKVILKQLVDAAIEMLSRGVFHRDIKLENILIEKGTDAPRLRFIDFGCATTCTPEEVFTVCTGTKVYTPPELHQHHCCMAGPTTVWQLGVVMYGLLHRKLPFRTSRGIMCNHPLILSEFSEDCKDFLRGCLTKDPQLRLTLERLQGHAWLKYPQPGVLLLVVFSFLSYRSPTGRTGDTLTPGPKSQREVITNEVSMQGCKWLINAGSREDGEVIELREK